MIDFQLPEVITKENVEQVVCGIYEYFDQFGELGELHPELVKKRANLIISVKAKVRWADKSFREKTVEAMNKPENIEKISEASKKNWADPEYRKKTLENMKGSREDPETKERHREALREAWKDPDLRKRCSEQVSKTKNSPEGRKIVERVGRENAARWENDKEFRDKITTKIREACNTPEYIEKMSKISKETWADPEYREKMLKSFNHPDHVKKQSEIAKELWKNPEYIKARNASTRSAEYKGISFDSWWEVEVYKKLEELGIPFDFHSSFIEIVYENDYIATWNPDFDILTPFGPVHLEVKGHPFAIEKWLEDTLPALLRTNIPVLVLFSDGYYQLDKVSSLLDLVKLCEGINIMKEN